MQYTIYIFSILVLAALLNTGCEKCPVCPNENNGLIHILYPQNLQENIWLSPELKWCVLEGASEYQLYISMEAPSHLDATAVLDTIIFSPSCILKKIYYQHTNGNSYYNSLLVNQSYKWKVRARIDGVFTEWSDEYRFKTGDALNLIPGTYPVSKYNYWIGFHHIFGNCRDGQVCKSYIGQSEITVSKNPGGGLMIKEKNGGTHIYDNGTITTFWALNDYGRTMDAIFNPSLDSFTVEFNTRGVDIDRESGILFVGAMPR